MLKAKVSATVLLLVLASTFCTGQEKELEQNFEQVHEEDFREGRSAFSWMFPKQSGGSCSDGRSGVCVSSALCRKYGGTRSGSCSGGGGNVCCDVTYSNCREESVCTISINGSRVSLSNTQAGIFDLRFPRIKNTDMVKLEFLADSRLQPAVRETEVTTMPAMLKRNIGKCMTESISFSGSPTINNPFVICGDLVGQHVFLAFGNTDSVMMHVNKMASSGVNVRATWYSRRFIPVPQNCLQYFTTTNVEIKSFGWPDQQINDLRYTVCFDERQSNSLTMMDCTVANNNNNNNNNAQGTFSITGIRNEAINDPDFVNGSPFVPLLDCYRDWVQLFGENKYCNQTLPREGLTTTTKPFQMAVNFDSAENRAFLQPAPVGGGACVSTSPCFTCTDAAPVYPNMCTCVENPAPDANAPPGLALQCAMEATLNRVDRYNRGFCLRAMRA